MKIYSINPTNYNRTQLNRHIPTNISFKGDSSNAALSLQNPDVAQFEHNFKGTVNSDAVQSNPITAVGYKIKRVLNLFFQPGFEPSYRPEEMTGILPY